MPNVMAALSNIGGALCSTPQCLLTPTTRVPCSNAAKTRNPLKFTGVPQTRQQILAVSGPKFTVLSEHVEKVLLFNKFFPIVDTCLSCEDIARQSCTMMRSWTQSEFCTWQNSVRCQELPKMYIQCTRSGYGRT